jgi:phosphoglycerate dehydrogenase-like enzyme
MKRILVDVAIHEGMLAQLRQQPGLRIETITPEQCARPLPPALIQDVHVLFCTFPPANFDEMKQLEWIQITSAGYSQLLDLDLPSRSVHAANARGVFDVPIAEWNIAMMVNLRRNLRQMIRNQEAARWDRAARFQREIRGATLGLWGYGGIARETARLARLMGMRVHVLSRNGVGPAGDVYCLPGAGDPEGVLPHEVFLQDREQEFLAGLDFLVLAMPLTHSTRGIIGEDQLGALAPTACLLNPARGPLIQEHALLRALREGWIAAAALDTHYQYPLPPNHPLWTIPNVILTPHISGSDQNPAYLRRIWDVFVHNIGRWSAGRPLLNELSGSQLRGE